MWAWLLMDRAEASCPVMKGLRSYMNVMLSYGVSGRTCDYKPISSAPPLESSECGRDSHHT
jgi:hypothetical protein